MKPEQSQTDYTKEGIIESSSWDSKHANKKWREVKSESDLKRLEEQRLKDFQPPEDD